MLSFCMSSIESLSSTQLHVKYPCSGILSKDCMVQLACVGVLADLMQVFALCCFML